MTAYDPVQLRCFYLHEPLDMLFHFFVFIFDGLPAKIPENNRFCLESGVCSAVRQLPWRESGRAARLEDSE